MIIILRKTLFDYILISLNFHTMSTKQNKTSPDSEPQLSFPAKVLGWFKEYDENMSSKIHNMKYSWTMDYSLYVPALAFNRPTGICICALALAFFFTNIEKEMLTM